MSQIKSKILNKLRENGVIGSGKGTITIEFDFTRELIDCYIPEFDVHTTATIKSVSVTENIPNDIKHYIETSVEYMFEDIYESFYNGTQYCMDDLMDDLGYNPDNIDSQGMMELLVNDIIFG